MAAFDNFDEVFFTVQSLRFNHLKAIERFEIVVVDNNPSSRDGEAIKSFIEGRVNDRGRYVTYTEKKGSVPPRAHLFDVAKGKFVVCIDSHVLFDEGSLERLVRYFDANPESDDLLHGVLVSNYGPHRIEGTHMIPQWRSHMFGTWGVDERGKDINGEPFDIPQHGLGFFAARRESWLRFRDDFSGFSGGEGYIHEKYRQAGRRVLCLPGVRWVHKFARPHGIPHRPQLNDKIRNHIRGWNELGVDLQTGSRENPLGSICDHYVGGVGAREGKPALSWHNWLKLCKECGVEFTGPEPNRAKMGVVIGPTSFGSYGMCGRPIAQALGWPQLNSRSKVNLAQDVDVALVVKAGVPPIVRQRAGRVIWYPLDIWFGDRRSAELEPRKWCRLNFEAHKFDEIIVCTKALKEAAEAELSGSRVRVHLVPHHADPRVGMDWHDPAGPIVYSGQTDFVGEEGLEVCRQAAKEIGRPFKHSTSFDVLKGASLVLAPRLLLRTKLNVLAKPTVKIANAAQAGIPVLATNDASICDLFPDVRTAPVEEWRTPEALSRLMAEALGDQASIVRFPFEEWRTRMMEIIEG